MPDIELIRRTLILYSMLLDDLRYEEWGDLFTEDADWLTIPGIMESTTAPLVEARGRGDIVEKTKAFLKASRKNDEARAVHLVAPALINIDGDQATASWDVVSFNIDTAGIIVKAAGRYYAKLVKQGHIWRFTQRVSVRPNGTLPNGVMPVPSH